MASRAYAGGVGVKRDRSFVGDVWEKAIPNTSWGATAGGSQQIGAGSFEPSVQPSQFGAIPPPTQESGLSGVFVSGGNYQICIPDLVARRFQKQNHISPIDGSKISQMLGETNPELNHIRWDNP